MMATKFTRNSSTLGVQSNVNENDTSQWKLWIGIYLKCIHEQGEYFCIIVRIKGIDVSTYLYTSGVRTTYPSGAFEFTPISCVELMFLNL